MVLVSRYPWLGVMNKLRGGKREQTQDAGTSTNKSKREMLLRYEVTRWLLKEASSTGKIVDEKRSGSGRVRSGAVGGAKLAWWCEREKPLGPEIRWCGSTPWQ
jgi:hypothetical protein